MGRKRKKSMDPPFVVKVQLSLFTSEDVQQVLVYNKDRSIQWTGDASKDIVTLMQGKPKKFFWAEVIDSKLSIIPDVRVPNQLMF